MYESPISLIISEMTQKIANETDKTIWQAIQKCGVDVDKDELIRALQYDRRQYEKGYQDGLNANRWISVEDRLPPANDLVIVSINDDRGDNDYRYTDVGWYLTEGQCWIVDNEATINVEAWMPMPKPYEPQKEE